LADRETRQARGVVVLHKFAQSLDGNPQLLSAVAH